MKFRIGDEVEYIGDPILGLYGHNKGVVTGLVYDNEEFPYTVHFAGITHGSFREASLELWVEPRKIFIEMEL